MSSTSLPSIFQQRSTVRSIDIAETHSSEVGNSVSAQVLSSFKATRRSTIPTVTTISNISTRHSLKEKVAIASDGILKNLRLAGLRSEEIGDDGTTSDKEEADKPETKYVEVGVNELYRHRLGECIRRRRNSVEIAPNLLIKEAWLNKHDDDSVTSTSDDEKFDDKFINSMTKLDDKGTSSARKPRTRQSRRDSLQSLASIEQRLKKNHIGFVAKKKKNQPRAVRRSSLQSLASIEKQLVKNKLAAPTRRTSDIDNNNKEGRAQEPKGTDIVVSFHHKRASEISNVSALLWDSSTSFGDWELSRLH